MDIEKLEGGGYKATGDFIQELYEHMSAGNSNCTYQIGDKIEKITFVEGDQSPIGTKGVVYGNAITGDGEEFYLVLFENREHLTFITKDKISLQSNATV